MFLVFGRPQYWGHVQMHLRHFSHPLSCRACSFSRVVMTLMSTKAA